MKLFIPVEPMGAVRMTRRGKYIVPSAQRYLDYKAQVAWEAKRQLRAESPIDTAVKIKNLIFHMPIPKTGRTYYKEDGKRKSRKIKEGDYHTVKPDVDNLFKGVTDSLNGILWSDDSLICEVERQRKIYSETPGILIEFEEVEGIG